ncbi:hypothetical protein Lal_00032022 [Lupinus albus]|nr:hypothetical protein Lal_00032022 [Lupinus albus]
MAGGGTCHNVQNDLLVQMVAALQQMNENLRSLNQNPTPRNGADLPGHELFGGSVVGLCHLHASDGG